MENEFSKKVGRETFEKLSQSTQAIILQCFDHQKWLETEQAKLEYIYSLAQLHPAYLKYQNGLAETAEQKIQRAFQTLLLEGGAMPVAQSTHPSTKGNGATKKNGDSLSFTEDLERSLDTL